MHFPVRNFLRSWQFLDNKFRDSARLSRVGGHLFLISVNFNHGKEHEVRIISKTIVHHLNMVRALSEGLHHGPTEYHRFGGD